MRTRNHLPLVFLLAALLVLPLLPGFAWAEEAAVLEEVVTEEVIAPEETEPADAVESVEEAEPAEVAEPVEETEPVEEVAVEEEIEETVEPIEAEAITNVAQIGTRKYTTLEEAVSRAVDGDTIVILADYEMPDTITVSKTITIDTNGHTLSSGFTDSLNGLFNVTGNLTLVGNGSLVKSDRYAIVIKEGSVVVDGPAVRAESWTIDLSRGTTLTVRSGSVIADSSYAIASWSNASGTSPCVINIEGGTIAASGIAINLQATYTTLNISGGSITGRQGVDVYYTHINVNMTGGTIDAERYGIVSHVGDSPVVVSGGSVSGGERCITSDPSNNYPWTSIFKLQGGTFSGDVYVQHGSGFISGGTFDRPVPSGYLAAGVSQNASGEVVVDVSRYPVRLVHNSTPSLKTSLADAVSAAANGDTIELLTDITQTAAIDISGIGVTLDLAGHELSYNGDSRYLIRATESGSITIADSSEDATGAIDFSSTSTGGSGRIAALWADGGTVAVHGGSVYGNEYGIFTKGEGNAVEVAGATVTGGLTGIYVGSYAASESATVTIGEGAHVEGEAANGSGIFVNAGTATIDITGGVITGFQGINQANGTMTLTMSAGEVEGSSTTSLASVAAIAAKGTSTVTITGGTVSGTNALILMPSSSSATCAPTISGGDFFGTVTSDTSGFVTGGTFDALDDRYVAEGYAKQAIEGDRVAVVHDDLVAVLFPSSATYDRTDHTPEVFVGFVSQAEAVVPDSVVWTLGGEEVTSLVDAGTYVVTATLGDETATAEFVIEPRNIDEVLPAQDDPCWTKQLTITGGFDPTQLSYNGVTLAEGTDFTTRSLSEWSSEYYEASWDEEVEYTGQGNFCGTTTRTTTFLAYQMSGDEVRILDIPNQCYTGTPVTPSVSAQFQPDGVHWVPIDHKVTYENNDAPGTGTAVVTLQFPWYGTFTKDFQIIDVQELSEALKDSFDLLQSAVPNTTDPLDIPGGATVMPQDAIDALSAAHNAATEVLDAPQSAEQVAQATAELEAAIEAARAVATTHALDRSAWDKVSDEIGTALSSSAVSTDAKTYSKLMDGTTQNLEPGQQFYMLNDVQAFYGAAVGASQANMAATTQRQVNEAVAAAQAALDAFEAAAHTYAAPAPMYRLYNRWTYEHFYCASEEERDKLVSVGWTYEGVGWYAPSFGDPVYRLYNKWAPGGDHHYTMSKDEYDYLCSVGWTGEGIGWYSDFSHEVPVYREYNPYETAHNHNYTPDRAEHENLVSLGWHDEGIGWYGVQP